MASKAKAIVSTGSTQPGAAVEERERLLQSRREQEIRNRAYEIYLQRGAQCVYKVWHEPSKEVHVWAAKAVGGMKTHVNRSTLPICLRGGGRLGTTAALNQDSTTVYHHRLPGAESFLHQK